MQSSESEVVSRVLFVIIGIIVYIFFGFLLSQNDETLLLEKLILLIVFFIGLIILRIIGLRELNSIKWIVQKIFKLNP